MSDGGPPTSPCIGVCIMNAESGYCHGCQRTLAEISSWLELTPRQRAAICAELEHRRSTQPLRKDT